MPRKKGDLSSSGIKGDIIKFILKSEGSVKELDIREHLEKEYNKNVDQGNVNKHLHKLNEYVCIELKTIKKGERKYNHCNITNLEHLKNIRTRLKDIKLNEYEKSLIIILKNIGYDLKELGGLQLYIQLLLSPSFFNTCMDMDFETLCLRSWEIYRHDHEYNFYKLIEDNWKTMKEDPDNVYSYNEFVETFLKLIKELPMNIHEMLMLEDERLYGIDEEIVTKLQLDEATEFCLRWMIIEYIEIYNHTYLTLLLNHFFHQDILQNCASSDEIEFMTKIEKNMILYGRCDNKNSVYNTWVLDDLKHTSELIYKYKTPFIFGSGNSPEDVYQKLIRFYENSLKEYKRSFFS